MHANDGRVVSNFILQILKNEPVTVYGEGLQTRSFCYVNDLVKGLFKAMNTKGVSGPVNLGNPQETAILELANLIMEKTGISVSIEYKAMPTDDPLRRKPDIGLAKKIFDWEPSIGIEEGLDRTIEYFRSVHYL